MAKKICDIRLTTSDIAYLIEDAKLVDWKGVPCLRGPIILRTPAYFGSGSVATIPLREIRVVFEFPSLDAYLQEVYRQQRGRSAVALSVEGVTAKAAKKKGKRR